MAGPRSNRRAPPVVYDPDAHREFVTGFRRRKQARRQEAAASAASAEKEARRATRKEKREVLRATVEKAREYSDDDSDEDATAAEISREETTYQADDAVITAVVAPLETAIDKRVARDQESSKKVTARGVADGTEKTSRIAKVRKPASGGGRKRKVSYTHTLSKLNKRKLKLKRRKAEKN